MRPLTVLIAALGGEGGGVLTDWIVAAAESQSFPVQSTSIPGVAQRTGATTYHIELVPSSVTKSDKRRPILTLAPGVGEVDLVVASELMEAGRAIAGGFVTPDRTTTIASTSRSYLVVEKMAMGDGRYDQPRLAKVEKNSRAHVLIDIERDRARTGAMINAVMLDIIAGGGGLPIPTEAFEAAIRADGRAVDAKLRGFRAGLDAVQNGREAALQSDIRDRSGRREAPDLEKRNPKNSGSRTCDHERRRAPARRLSGATPMPALSRPARADPRRRRPGRADGRLLRETARHLAVRMSYEDVIRVAQAKTDPARFARIAAQMGIKPDEPVQSRNSSSPASRNCARCCRRGWRGTCSRWPNGIAKNLAPLPLGHGDQHHLGVGLSALLHPRRAAPLAAEDVALSGGTARHRTLAPPHLECGPIVRRACASRSPSARA